MKRILLLLALISSFAFSVIDEYKTDIYFGNGILTEDTDAEKNAGIIEKAIKQKFGPDYYNKHIGKVDYAYNSTLGPTKDLYESYLQLLEETTLFKKKMVEFGIHFFNEDNITGRDILNEKVNKKGIGVR